MTPRGKSSTESGRLMIGPSRLPIVVGEQVVEVGVDAARFGHCLVPREARQPQQQLGAPLGQLLARVWPRISKRAKRLLDTRDTGSGARRIGGRLTGSSLLCSGRGRT